MTRTPITPNERPKRPLRSGRLRSFTMLVLALLALVGLSTSALLIFGQRELEDHRTRLEDRTGLSIDIGGVSVTPFGDLRLDDVIIRAQAPSDLKLSIRHIDTDLGFMALLEGRRRPTSITLKQPRIEGRIDTALQRQWSAYIASTDGSGNSPQPEAREQSPESPPLRVLWDHLNGELMLAVEGARHPQLLGLQRLGAEEWSGELMIPDSSKLQEALLQTQGRLKIDGGIREASLKINTISSPSLELVFHQPVGARLNFEETLIDFQLMALQHQPNQGLTRLVGSAFRVGNNHILCAAIELDVQQGWLPAMDSLRAIRCLDVKLRAGDHQAFAHRLELHLSKTSFPTPHRLVIDDATVDSVDWRYDLSAGRVEASFQPDTTDALLRGDYGGILSSLTLVKPVLHLTLPEGAEEEKEEELPVTNALPPADDTVEQEEHTAHFGAAWTPWLGHGAFMLPFGEELTAYLRRARFSIREGRIEIDQASGEELDGMTLDDLFFSVQPSGESGITASLQAFTDRDKQRSGRITVTIDADSEGVVRSAQGIVSGENFAHLASELSPYVTVDRDSWVQMDFNYAWKTVPNPAHQLLGEIRFEEFGFEAWRVSHTPLSGLEGSLAFQAGLQPGQHRLDIALSRFELGETAFTAALSLSVPPETPPSFEVEVLMPRQDCGALARSIPQALIPRLSGMKLKGSLAFNARLEVDLADPYGLNLKVQGNTEQCKILSLGRHIHLAALRGPFVHHPIEPKRGRRFDISVGPGTDTWVPTGWLPRFVKDAAVVTEDRRYYEHKGVRWGLIERALKLNLDKGRFVYGGSTITQQLVKNLFLTREKTLSRKLEELFIVWEMERQFDKDEILTMYLNIIEYGPDIYGIRHAARHYFAKEAGHLSPAEAAFIMGLKPFPKAGYRQWISQKLNHWWVKRVEHVLNQLWQREHSISETEYLAAAPFQVSFRRPEETMVSGRRYSVPRTPTVEQTDDLEAVKQ